jgi:hypothetical protein
VVDFVRLQQRSVTIKFHPFENIRKIMSNQIKGLFAGVTGNNFFMNEMKAAQIVDAVDMVGMGMGKEHGIDAGNFVPDCLFPEIGRGIHEKVPAGGFDQDRGAGSFVPWIGGSADTAVAADHWNPRGSSAAEYGYFHGQFLGIIP